MQIRRTFAAARAGLTTGGAGTCLGHDALGLSGLILVGCWRSRNGIVTPRRTCGPSGHPVASGMEKISYAGYRFPPEIIDQAIWLYLRFTLSLRDVVGGTRSGGVLRDRSALGKSLRTDDRGRPAEASPEAAYDLAPRR